MLLKHDLTAFESGGSEVEGGGGGVLITSTQDRCGGNSAPFSHIKFVLVYFNHFETHMLDS